MGFKPKRKVYRLSFDDYEGLVVRARSTSLGQFFAVTELSTDTDLSESDTEQLKELFDPFIEALVEWNIEYPEEHLLEGQPVPPTMEGLLTLEMDFVMDLLMAWLDAIAAVPVPLEKPSEDGTKPPLEASIPMEVLSHVQAS